MPQTVLVADGDRTTLELMTAVLTRDGLEVVATPDGGDALSRFLEIRPFLVVCSETLPSLRGSELCRQIKAENPATRVVVLHENAGSIEGLGLAGEIGCDAVLPVPFKYGDLKKLLIEWQVLGPGAATTADRSAFSVPAGSDPKLELPPPVALPPDLAPSQAAATESPAADPGAIPPLPVPIPLPMVSQVAEEELPEMDLDEIAMPAVELDEVVEEATAAISPAPPAESMAPAEARAFSAAASLDIPLEGRFKDVPFSVVLYRLYLATFSGVLHLASSTANRSVYLWGGIPVRVDSNRLSETLGRMLLEHGRITFDQYNESLNLMKQRGWRHGEALLAIGAISEADLLDALREQTEIKVANTFAWRDAAYRIEQRTDFARDSVLSEVHPLRAIWRGVHEHYELEPLLAFLLPFQKKFVVGTDLFAVHYHTLGAHLRELDVVSHLDGNKTVEKILQLETRTLRIAQALYVLLVTDMARISEEPGEPVAPPAASNGEAAGLASNAGVDELAADIAAEYLRVKGGDSLDALRVDPSATPAEVDAAYQNIVGALRLQSLPAGLPPDAIRRAREIADVLAHAHAVVRDPARRDQYLREQQERFVATVPTAAEDEEDLPLPQPANLELAMPAGDVFGAQQAYADGQTLMGRSRYRDAAEKFRRAIEQARGEPLYRVALGQALWKEAGGQGEAARSQVVTCLQQALQLDPSHIEANLEMARLLVETGNRERAFSYVQRVLQKSSSHPEARRLLASLG
jgi:CheY-like chemotaxis protein